LQFSLQAASPDTFGHTIVCFLMRLAYLNTGVCVCVCGRKGFRVVVSFEETSSSKVTVLNYSVKHGLIKRSFMNITKFIAKNKFIK
jgi:hypothetical protein